MNFAEYVGLNNPEGVNRVLVRNGYEPCDYLEDCPNAIEFLCMEMGQTAIEQFLIEHPDYDIIVELDKKNNVKNASGDTIVAEPVIAAAPAPKVSSEIPKSMNDSLKEILIIIMAFWLLNKIISS